MITKVPLPHGNATKRVDEHRNRVYSVNFDAFRGSFEMVRDGYYGIAVDIIYRGKENAAVQKAN